MRTTLGYFLLSLLKSYGVKKIYGVPGDAITGIRQEMKTFGGIEHVALAHEASAGWSAEVCGRLKTLGVVYVTYNAGINNVLNALEEGFVHASAMLVIGGEPSMEFREKYSDCLHHHQLRRGDFDDQRRVTEAILGWQYVKSITNLVTAARDISSLVSKAVEERRPVYLGIPADAWHKEIEHEANNLRIQSESNLLQDTITNHGIADYWIDIAKRICGTIKNPFLFVGHYCQSYQLLPEVLLLAEKIQAVVTPFNGYGSFPTDHSSFLGTWIGPESIPRNVFDIVRQSQRIEIGVLETDLNSALHPETATLPPAIISLDPVKETLRVGFTSVSCNVSAQRYFLKRLAEEIDVEYETGKNRLPFSSWIQERNTTWEADRSKTPSQTIRVSDIAPIVTKFLEGKKLPVLCDVGDAMFLMPLIPSSFTYTANAAAMGIFAGCIGLEDATGKRPLVIVGDGAFAMGEIYSVVLSGAKPIIIILNNRGWAMMRQVGGEAGHEAGQKDALLFPRFRFEEIVKVLGEGVGFAVHTIQDLQGALEKSFESDSLAVINLHLDPNDITETLSSICR